MIGLCVALIPSAQSNWLMVSILWDDEYGTSSSNHTLFTTMTIPAYCFIRGSIHTTELFSPENGSAPISFGFPVLLLFSSYTARAIKLFDSSSVFTRRIVHDRLGNWVRHILDIWYEAMQKGRYIEAILSIRYWTVTICYIMARALLGVLDSMLWEVCSTELFNAFFNILLKQIMWLSSTLIWGTLRLLWTRAMADPRSWAYTFDYNNNKPSTFSIVDPLPDENSWGLGQSLPLLMLAIIPIAGYEFICG